MMDEILSIKVRDTLLKMPAIYLPGWPPADFAGKVNVYPYLAIDFWMPSGRPEPVKVWSFLVLSDFVRQGGKFAPGEFPVRVQMAQFVSPDDPDLILPEQRFRNLAAVDSGPGDVFEEKFGLEDFFLEKDRLNLRSLRNLPGSQPQILLRCGNRDRPAINEICDGFVYFNDDQLSFHVSFHLPQLPHWRESVLKARDLLLAWRQ